MKIIKYKLILTAVPFPIEWQTTATNLKAAIIKAKAEIKFHFNLTAGKLLHSDILSQKEI